MKVEADKHLLGTSVLTRYNNKSYKIDELDFSASPKDTFQNERGDEVSYMDYYKNQYGIQIQVSQILFQLEFTRTCNRFVTDAFYFRTKINLCSSTVRRKSLSPRKRPIRSSA